MPRRPVELTPDEVIIELVDILENFKEKLRQKDLRQKVLSIVPAFHKIRDLGSSLIPRQSANAARDRILFYFKKYPLQMIHGDELMVVSGIQDWPRRIRELRCELGWSIASGITLQEMFTDDTFQFKNIQITKLKPEEYILLSIKQDRDAAFRWKMANEIRKEKGGIRDKLLVFMRKNIGKPITGEELRYVANDKTEWARRIRELRTELGWPVATRNTGRPDLPVGTYVLEQDRQSPPHDRQIPDSVRRAVMRRDKYKCCHCGWTQRDWNSSDPRHIEIHHTIHHKAGGSNVVDNLVALCNICHDEVHRKSSRTKR